MFTIRTEEGCVGDLITPASDLTSLVSFHSIQLTRLLYFVAIVWQSVSTFPTALFELQSIYI